MIEKRKNQARWSNKWFDVNEMSRMKGTFLSVFVAHVFPRPHFKKWSQNNRSSLKFWFLINQVRKNAAITGLPGYGKGW